MHVNKHFQLLKDLQNALDGNFFKGSGENASRLYPVVVILTSTCSVSFFHEVYVLLEYLTVLFD